MWRVDYYTEASGHSPVAKWLDEDLDKKTSAYIYDRLLRLEENGFKLLSTKMIRRIEGYGSDFYEVKCRQYRVAMFYHTSSKTFFLLHGFKKERRRERKELQLAYVRLNALRRRLDGI